MGGWDGVKDKALITRERLCPILIKKHYAMRLSHSAFYIVPSMTLKRLKFCLAERHLNFRLPVDDTTLKNDGKKGNCMDFLKEILGDDLFKQFEEKLNAYNGNEANKDKQIKLANLAGGEYVGKGKYDALQTLLDGKTGELDKANGLIEELKKGTKGNEALQSKISTYEGQVKELQEQLRETKIKSAIKVALLSEKALDVDYLTFKLESKLKDENQTLELDENDNIKGWDNMISGLKTQFPNQFETSSSKKFEEHKLEQGEEQTTFTKSDILKKPYAERMKIYNENPEAYNEAMKG